MWISKFQAEDHGFRRRQIDFSHLMGLFDPNFVRDFKK